jgi:hypothetical protein
MGWRCAATSSPIIREGLVVRRCRRAAIIPLTTGALSDVQVEQSGGRTDKYREFALAVDNARSAGRPAKRRVNNPLGV